MKDMIVIEKELLGKIIKASPIQWFDNKEKTDKLVLFGKEYKTEKEPETWEELKELCKATNYIQDILKKNRQEPNIPVYLNDCGTGYIIIKDLYFGENGIVFYEVQEQRYIIAKDLTFAQMWMIIMGLLGE